MKYQIKTYLSNGEKHISHEMTKVEMLKWKRINDKNGVVACYFKIVGNDAEEIIR